MGRGLGETTDKKNAPGVVSDGWLAITFNLRFLILKTKNKKSNEKCQNATELILKLQIMFSVLDKLGFAHFILAAAIGFMAPATQIILNARISTAKELSGSVSWLMMTANLRNSYLR